MTIQVKKTDEEWKAQLTKEEYGVLRKSHTERPWSGDYVETKTEGIYRCKACNTELFRSSEKFDSHCGWPSFWAPGDEANVTLHEDRSMGSLRTEVRCAACDSHLGHVFMGEGYDTPTDARFCINSVSLTLEPTS